VRELNRERLIERTMETDILRERESRRMRKSMFVRERYRHKYIHMYIYIYIEREKRKERKAEERKSDTESVEGVFEIERERENLLCYVSTLL